MTKYIIKRILYALPTLFLVMTIVFFMLHVIGGSPVYSMVDMSDISQEELDALNAKYGFDRPIIVQYADYLKGVITGNWGTSYFDGKDVFQNILDHMEPTILITICSTLITVLIGVPIGIIAATNRNSWLDYTLSTTSMVFLTIPTFWLGVMMVYFLAFKLHLFPTQGYHNIAKYGLKEALSYVAMPSLALGMTHVANIARNTRSSMLDVLGEDYIRTARAKGLPMRKVYFKHALRNVIALIAMLISSSVVGMLGGSTVVENVFNIDGIGKYAYHALLRRDYTQEQAILLFMSIIYVVMNMIMDIIHKMIDPRVDFS